MRVGDRPEEAQCVPPSFQEQGFYLQNILPDKMFGVSQQFALTQIHCRCLCECLNLFRKELMFPG